MSWRMLECNRRAVCDTGGAEKCQDGDKLSEKTDMTSHRTNDVLFLPKAFTTPLAIAFDHSTKLFELVISRTWNPGARDISNIQTVLSIDQTLLQKGLLHMPAPADTYKVYFRLLEGISVVSMRDQHRQSKQGPGS